MSLMPVTASSVSQTGVVATVGAPGAAADGLEQLFARLMEQMQAALELPQLEAGGSGLPLDGEALPPELLAQLAEFTEPLEGELSAAQQEQLDALMRQLGAGGLPQDRARELAQAALLLQVPRPVGDVMAESDEGAVASDLRPVDERLAQAERLRAGQTSESSGADAANAEIDAGSESGLSASPSPVVPLVEADQAAAEMAAVISLPAEAAAQGRVEGTGLAQSEGQDQSRGQGQSQAQALAPESRQSDLSDPEVQADGITALAPAGVVSDAPRERAAESARAAVIVSSPGVTPADRAAEQQARAAQAADVKMAAGAADAESARQDGRHDGRPEQGLARWAELRDSVMAQGEKLAQHDAMFRGGMAAPMAVGQAESGALVQADRATSLSQLQQAYQASTANGLTVGLNERFGGDRWAPAASQRILWMAGQNVSTVELRLSPPELGSLGIKLDIRGDQASISFASPHAHVREVLEQQMPRLREMLAENGIELGQADVSDQSQPKSSSDEEARRGGDVVAGDDDSEQAGRSEPVMTQAQRALSLVDYYA